MNWDHLGFFINIEFLAWVDSPFSVEYNGESFKSKYWSQAELWQFLCIRVHSFNFRKTSIEELKVHWEVHIVTINYVQCYNYMTELHKHSISIRWLKFKFSGMLKNRKWMKIWFYTSLAVIGNWTFIPNGPFSYSRSQTTMS